MSSVVEDALNLWVAGESQKLASRLNTQPQQQQAAVSSISQPRNAQASVESPAFYKKPGVIVAGIVVVVVAAFVLSRK